MVSIPLTVVKITFLALGLAHFAVGEVGGKSMWFQGVSVGEVGG